MSDVHPEALLDKVRRGTASDEERRKADAHLADCDVCAVEDDLIADFAALRAAGPEDDALIDRVLAAPPKRRHNSGVMLISAAALLIAGAAAAGYVAQQSTAESAAPPAESAAPPPAQQVATTPATAPAPVPPPSIVAPQPVSEPPSELEQPPATTAAPYHTKGSYSAANLYAKANAARGAGQYQKAAALYNKLAVEFPKSRQAAASRMALGRMLLMHMGKPAEALAVFDSYQGALSEEALVGRALALQQLGRTGEERSAWQQLLAAHPGSLHAERAKKRLDALR